MPHSPTATSSSRQILQYDRGWAVVNRLLRAGRSFSGRERNCCFLNIGTPRFANVSAATGLDLIDDGRTIALVDWDFDGDLDMWLTNRTGPRVRFLRNDMVTDSGHLALDLRGTTCNPDAVGARVEVYPTATDRPIVRTLYAGEGYLAKSSHWLHFGLGRHRTIDKVVVHWPQREDRTEVFTNLKVNGRYRLVQGSGVALVSEVPLLKTNLKPSSLKPSAPVVPPSKDTSRVVLLEPGPLPEMKYVGRKTTPIPVLDGSRSALLINIWSSTCMPCLAEMTEWGKHATQFKRRGLRVLGICVDEPSGDRAADYRKARRLADRIGFSYPIGLPTGSLITSLDTVQRTYVGIQRPMGVPTSFLIDCSGNVAVIYRGAVSAKELIQDLSILGVGRESIVKAAVPFPGQWLKLPSVTGPRTVASLFVDRGQTNEAKAYLRKMIDLYAGRLKFESGEARIECQNNLSGSHNLLGRILYDEKKYPEALKEYSAVLAIDPNQRDIHLELERLYKALGQPQKAAEHLAKAVQLRRSDPENLFKLALSKAQSGIRGEAMALLNEAQDLRKTAPAHALLANLLLAEAQPRKAMENYRAALTLRPGWPLPANDLAWVLATHPVNELRDGAEAVRLANIACEGTNHKNPLYLGTLAAALAEDGRFEQAVKTVNEAIQLATADSTTNQPLVGQLRMRLDLFKEKKPYRDRSLRSDSAK